MLSKEEKEEKKSIENSSDARHFNNTL